MKQIRWCVIFVVVLIMGVLTTGKNVFALNEEWYMDYVYRLESKSDDVDENYIVLQEYTKSVKSLYVPATAIIDGVTYHTKLETTGNDGMWYITCDTLQEITFEKGCKVADGRFLFCGLSKLEKVNVEALDMSQATSTAWMFSNCKNLTKLNVADWDLSNVTNMFNMFGGCENLSDINVSKWNTSNVTTMISVFDHCKSLYKVNVKDWDVSKVTDMSSMFYLCEKLDSLDLHKWNTSNVTNMWEMFGRCYSLRTINVKGWDTTNVTSMAGMFCCNYSLTSLDLSSFDMSKVIFNQYDDSMFTRCDSLKSIKTPKKIKQRLDFHSGLTYAKKTSAGKSKKRYKYIPKTSKSITLVCVCSQSKNTQITSIQSSGRNIKLKWNKVKVKNYLPVQYEVQCSTKKNFSNAVGKMTNATDDTYSVQDNVTEKTSTTIKGLTKGKTYYVRVRVYTYGKTLSKWSKVKKIKVK